MRLYPSSGTTGMVYIGSEVETGSLAATVNTYERWLLVGDGTNLTLYRDGTASTPVAVTTAHLGYGTPELVLGRGATGTGYAEVDVEGLALWDAPLSSGERSDFFAGVGPATIRTADLYDFWALISNGNGVNGNTMTFTGGSFVPGPGGAPPILSPLQTFGPSYAVNRAANY
ncbi:LamG domain-containing protein [Solirubrobacter phytolaccae]|uniref:LamG domain-containing protein n=1 Tax=Solirubrobacter phytolaccae TaxID=1404360 RepID=A0A9X3SDV8_9ACTN|nr:hypothetical protein [Solirubrobacter phytolaccae]MDA0184130.1 LamG domain-containing protein [Solirubrobacter phytolaccae]